MANLIPWDDITPGLTVWEESAWGSVVRAVVTRRIAKRLVLRYEGGTHPVTLMVTRADQYRYWDAEPTQREREEAAWGNESP